MINSYGRFGVFMGAILLALLVAYIKASYDEWLAKNKELKPEDFKVKEASGEGCEGCILFGKIKGLNCEYDKGAELCDEIFKKEDYYSIGCYGKIAKIKFKSIWKLKYLK